MGVLLVLVVLVSGFIYCHEHPDYFYKLHRYEGQYLYLQAAKLGVWCVFLSVLFNVTLLKITSISVPYFGRKLGIDYLSLIEDLVKVQHLVKADEANITAWALILSVTSLLIPYLAKWSYIFFIKNRYALDSDEQVKLFLMSKEFSDSPLSDLLFGSMLSQESLMFTLEDRKVYIGKVSTTGEPNETEGADKEITIVPIMSGYRDKDTLTVEFTTDYQNINSQFSLVIRQGNIVSVRPYDFDVHDSFKTIANSPPPLGS